MQVLNMIKEFEMQTIKKLEIVKEYAERLLGIDNRVRSKTLNFMMTELLRKFLLLSLKI